MDAHYINISVIGFVLLFAHSSQFQYELHIAKERRAKKEREKREWRGREND